jgi:hypothetical protein
VHGLRDRGNGPLDASVRVGGFQDRLLLVPCAFAKDAVQPEADEQRNQREDDDDRQFL